MVKRVLLAVSLVFLVISLKAQYIKLDFNTTKINGGEYSPKHILAVWIEKGDGLFVNTLVVYAAERKGYLVNWNAASGGYKADAISGATLKNIQENHSVQWDLKDFAGSIIDNGNYKLCMEITSDDFAGPYREIEFEVDGNDFVIEPDDGANFANIKMVFENETTTSHLIDYNDKYLKIINQPDSKRFNMVVLAEKKSSAGVRVYDIGGKLVSSTIIELEKGENTVEGHKILNKTQPGVYFIHIESDHYKVAKKFIFN